MEIEEDLSLRQIAATLGNYKVERSGLTPPISLVSSAQSRLTPVIRDYKSADESDDSDNCSFSLFDSDTEDEFSGFVDAEESLTIPVEDKMKVSELTPRLEAISLGKSSGEKLPIKNSSDPGILSEIEHKVLGMFSSDRSSLGRGSMPSKIPAEQVNSLLYKHKGIGGTPLAEVLSIIINPVAKECKLNGKIWVEDDKGLVDNIFCILEHEDPKLITSSDNDLFVCQSNRAIMGSAYFNVHFDLNDGDSKFLQESFSWCAASGKDYDKVCKETIKGEHGSVTMSYIVHSFAIECHIMARLKKYETDRNSIPAMVARYKNMRYDYDRSDGLTEYTEFAIFVDDTTFRFGKSVLAIPIFSPLIIDLYLRKGEDNKGRCPVVWNKEVEFSSWDIICGNDKDIELPNGFIKLDVYGINYAEIPFTVLEEMKVRMRKDGQIPDRWTYSDNDDSADDYDYD